MLPIFLLLVVKSKRSALKEELLNTKEPGIVGLRIYSPTNGTPMANDAKIKR